MASHLSQVAFVGRADDVSKITDIFADPNCRLLTIVGPGGIGKTRLAYEVAAQLTGQFADGVVTTVLEAVTSRDLLVSAIADSLDIPLSGGGAPTEQLIRFLVEKHILLVLDSFEALLSELDVIMDLLNGTSQVKLLVTSRETLNLRDEWIYPLKGLPVPDGEVTADTAANYAALQLFAQHAQRVRHNFDLNEDLSAVARICRAVQGMPLGIELAASWARALTCAEIAAEIEQNLDFLATNLRDFPERHRSMRAVFDQSWAHLTATERDVFKRLAVFQGSFRREAADQIVGAALQTLSSLVDKSLLRREDDGRYHLHSLLRQYAAEHLGQESELYAAARAAHSAYFVDFLKEREAHLMGGRQLEAIHELLPELDNVRVAWLYLIEHCDSEGIQRASYALNLVYDFTARYIEYIDAFERACACLQPDDGDVEQLPLETAETLAGMLVTLGWGYVRVARVDEARQLFEQAQVIYQRYDFEPLPGLATIPEGGLGILAMIAGDFEDAIRFGQHVLAISTARMDYQNQALAHYLLSAAAQAQGHYHQAYDHALQANTITKAVGDIWFSAYCLSEMGHAARFLGNEAEARAYYQSSYDIRKKFKDPQGQALALNHLGKVALLEHDYAQAADYYTQSLTIYRRIGDNGGLAEALTGLGEARAAQGQFMEAKAAFQEALDIALKSGLISLLLYTLGCIGYLSIAHEHVAPGAELLALIAAHPSSQQEVRDMAQTGLAEAKALLSSEEFEAAYARGTAADIQTAANTARSALHSLLPQWVAVATGTPSDDNSSPLLDPLSEREIEILQLLASGLSNQQIAEKLFLALGTVKAHNHHIFGKLGVRNRVKAVVAARELGLID